MKLSAAQLLKRLEQGEDLEAINASLISPAEQALLSCCAVVRTFDEALVDNYFRPHVGVDKESIPFSSLTSYDFVQRVPRTDGVYLLAPDSRKKYYDAWWNDDANLIEPPSLAPFALLKLSRKLLEHYSALGDSAKLDALIQQVFVDPHKGWQTFQSLYNSADTDFALAQCRDIINALKGLENVLGPTLAEQLNETERYLQARSFWATEYYQTVSYYDRKELSDELETFLTNGAKSDPDKKWILQLHAPGGMGKTMFVRWLISRRCLPEPYRIPCGRLDFDFVEDKKVAEHRWRLFLDLAREIDAQIPGQILSSLIKKFTDHERILEHQQSQPVTSPTPEQLDAQKKQEEARETEILFLFGEAIKNAKLDKPIIFIFDTLEEVILYRPNDLVEIVRLINRLRATIPNLLLVLSGRYDLSEPKPDAAIRVPEFIDEFGRFVQTVHIEPFADEEALGFLQLRGLTEDRPLQAVVDRAEGHPFKLALFADILLDDPKITEETIGAYPTADLLYLIERVLARIPKNLRWLLRYGVVPRQLTLSFVKDVMKPHLLRAISGDESQDDPQRSRILTEKVQKKIQEKQIFRVESPQHELDLDNLWTELQKYASRSSWVTIKPSDPHTAGFHNDVVNPMRRWLEKEPVYKSIHRDAIAYYENKAKANPAEWSKSMRDAVYHAFQLEGVKAADYWHRLITNEEDAERRRELASEIVGSEYVDDEFNPLKLDDDTEIIDQATLAEGYFYLTTGRVEIARLRNAPPNDKLWSEAENSFQKLEQLQRDLPQPIASPAMLASIRAAILTNKGQIDQAISILEEALSQHPDERARMNLELELANSHSSRGNYQQGIHYWESALQRAESLRLGTDLTLEMRRNLARLHRNFDLEASAREFKNVLRVAGEDTKIRGEVLNELTDLFFEMGQFAQTSEASESLRANESLTTISQVRYLNQKIRLLIAVGNPLRAVSLDPASLVSDLITAAPEARDALEKLLVESIELRGTVYGILSDIEMARDNFERARSRWHGRGDTKAVKRCMLKKAELFLEAGDIKQARAVINELSRLSNIDDQQLSLEEDLLILGSMHFTNEVENRRTFSKSLGERAVKEQWRPHLRATLMLRMGAWGLLSSGGKTANQFFSDLTNVLRLVQPVSTRMLLLDPLSEYSAFITIDYHVAQDLLDLFPLHRSDDDYHVNAPKVAELLRVLGRKDQAVALLKELIKSGPKGNLFAQRRLLLTLGRTDPRRSKLEDLMSFLQQFIDEYKEFPALCAATFIEFAELSFGTRSKEERLRMLDQADLLMLRSDHEPAGLRARELALRGRLTIKKDRDKGIALLKRAIEIFENDYNRLAAARLRRFVAAQEKRSQRSVDEVTKNVSPPADEKPSPVVDNNTATIHVESSWTENITINTTFPRETVKTLRVPIEPASTLDNLLAVETYENYSFAFLGMMSSNWIKCCLELGHVLIDKSFAGKLQAFASMKLRKPALSLIIEALQLSWVPWEMMVLPSHEDRPASISPAVSAFYRSLPPEDRSSGKLTGASLKDNVWLQFALKQLGPQKVTPDGIYGKLTEEAVRNFQQTSSLPNHGIFDGPTRRALKRAQHAFEGRERPRVLLMRASIERQRASSRGHDLYGISLDGLYRRHGFRDIVVVEDADVGKMQEALRSFQPDVVHICPTMEESTSIGIYLDVGAGGADVKPGRSAFKSKASRPSSSGDLDTLTLSAFSNIMISHRNITDARPVLILDVLGGGGRTELFTQLFLRNAFAAELYQLNAFESIIAMGLTPADWLAQMSDTLIQALAAFVPIGETVDRLRRVIDLGTYTRLAPVGNQPGPLRNPADDQYLSNAVAAAGIALFTQDPEM